MSRGMLSPKLQSQAIFHLGREISITELRLMPYIQFVMVNNQRIEPNRIKSSERDILQTWREEGHIEGGAGGLSITREFWDAINAIIWISYVIGEG